MAAENYKQQITVNGISYGIYNIRFLEDQKIVTISTLPFSIRILLENLLRHLDTDQASEDELLSVARFHTDEGDSLIPFYPSRVLMQDFTGVPAVVDFAAMRHAVEQQGFDPARINPMVPVDLIIDHSIQVDHYKEKNAAHLNVLKEYQRNSERYQLLKWAKQNFNNFRVVPPESGICHQVNLEHIAQVVSTSKTQDGMIAFPDTLVGTDSHTTMINSLGVLGWGVGGIEAEAVMLGEPYYMNLPQVIGVHLFGSPGPDITATDMVLYITQVLRKENVVEKIVEYTGPGLKALSLTDRATISNMAPEYGATAGFFPVDDETIHYLENTNRKDTAALVKAYCKTCGLFNDYQDTIVFTRKIEIDLSSVKPSVAGPYRPQDLILLSDLKSEAQKEFNLGGQMISQSDVESRRQKLSSGSIVIAAITSCTNTSNPYLMMGAGLAARNAVEKGLSVPWFVKTSLAPGSKVVIDYLENSGLTPFLQALGFNNAGFGCTTCIGNSGPLDPDIETAIKTNDLSVMSVLSGNRNFEARIHQLTRGNYLMSPVLVVMFALAGRIDIDFDTEPVGFSKQGHAVFLKDIWPDKNQIDQMVSTYVTDELYDRQYSKIFSGNQLWQDLEIEETSTFRFDPESQYIRNPPYFETFSQTPPVIEDIINARPLLFLGDSVTTDHISPAGAIPKDYPAGQYLMNLGIFPDHFNSYGSRRGNHEVMMRGTFANIRIQNKLVSGMGGFTRIFPQDRTAFTFDAAMEYQKSNIPLLVLGGREYGTGSSRDWAAKGTSLLGIKAVIAISFERIHRSNLVGMGILPLVFKDNQTIESLGLTGEETFNIKGLGHITPNCTLTVTATRNDVDMSFDVILKLYTHIEVEYIKNNGILAYVLRQIMSEKT